MKPLTLYPLWETLPYETAYIKLKVRKKPPNDKRFLRKHNDTRILNRDCG
jgi:hypothetical protein